MHRFKSILLVFLQFAFIIILLAGSSWFHRPGIAFAFIATAFLLAVWAIAAMQKSRLRIFPEPAEKAVLITNGPYRFIRHPMYTAVILGCTGLLTGHFSLLRLLVLLALTAVLIVKLRWEEKLLRKKFDGYSRYMNKTPALFPFLF